MQGGGGQFGDLQSNCTKDRAEHVPSAATQIHTNTNVRNKKKKKLQKKNTGNADANGEKKTGAGAGAVDSGRGISAYVAPET